MASQNILVSWQRGCNAVQHCEVQVKGSTMLQCVSHSQAFSDVKVVEYWLYGHTVSEFWKPDTDPKSLRGV